MGIVFSLFKKKKISTKEKLHQIENEIQALNSTLKRNIQLKNKCVWLLLITSIILYITIGSIIYLWYLPKQWLKRAVYILPLLGFPVLIFFLKKLLHFIFVTRTSKISKSLDELKLEKKQILENVMETETYKVAKEILEKFDPKRSLVEKDSVDGKDTRQDSNSELRRRHIQTPGGTAELNKMATPLQGRMIRPTPNSATPFPRMQQPIFNARSPMMTPRIPNAPILPRERSVIDKVAEYFVGDGPNNRYALICKQCFSHNGMALAEEFEYIAYKCCYCGFFNPPRKQRLIAPKDNIVTQTSSRDSGHSSSEEATHNETIEHGDRDSNVDITTQSKQSNVHEQESNDDEQESNVHEQESNVHEQESNELEQDSNLNKKTGTVSNVLNNDDSA